jgi:hypothetical protein
MNEVMGPRSMTDRQMRQAENLQTLFENVNKTITPPADEQMMTPEAARLFAVARTQLELACLAAVKAVSRMAG